MSGPGNNSRSADKEAADVHLLNCGLTRTCTIRVKEGEGRVSLHVATSDFFQFHMLVMDSERNLVFGPLTALSHLQAQQLSLLI